MQSEHKKDKINDWIWEKCVSDILVYALTASIDYRYDSGEEYKAKNIFDLIQIPKIAIIRKY